MKTIDLNTLAQVTGGLTNNAALTQQLTTLNQTLSSNANNQNNNFLTSPIGAIVLAKMMEKKNSVVSGPSGTVIA
jgi:hypothetical protein